MARELDEPWTKCRNPTDLDWTRAFAHDGRDPRSWHTKPYRGQHVLEQSYTANQYGAWISCARCALLHSSTHCSNDVSIDPVIGFSAGGSEANVTFERQRLHGEGGEGHDWRSRETEASKEETDTTNDDRVQQRVQFWSGIQCDDQLGNSSAQRNFDTTITSVLSDNSSVAPPCCEHPPEGKDESQTGKCSDDGRGPVKTLSGRLARKLQRSASLINAGLSKQVQSVLRAHFVLIAAL